MTPQAFVSILNQILPEPHASLLAGMLFGVRATMPPEFYQSLRITGTLHIIALSGMNITIIINVLGGIFMIFGRRLSSILSIIFIFLFVAFVGPSANVVRAALMGSLGLIGIFFGKQRLSVLTLLFTALFMLTLKPHWLWDIGFQLSFLSTLGIILLGGGGRYAVFNTRFRLLDNALATLWIDLRTTLSAQLFTFPVILYHFKQLSLVSPLTNVLVGWVVAPITVFGLFLSAVSWISLPIGQFMAWFIFPLLDYFVFVVEKTAELPFASLTF